MSKGQVFPRLSALIRQIILIVLYSISFMVSWLSCRNLNKKTLQARNNGRSSRHRTDHKHVECNGKVSIIIAVKNEAKYLGKTIRNLESTTVDKSRVEIVLVDAGCKDNTFEVARVSKGVIPIVEVKNNTPCGLSRGAAFNSGAEVASGDILLFLRADCTVPPGYDETLRRQLNGSSRTVMSAFRFDFDSPSSTTLTNSMVTSLRIISTYQNIMSSICRLPRGSQALAVTSTTFRHNKYPNDLLLMEDVAFVDRLRNYCATVGGEITILEQCVRSSSDDIVTIGALKSTLYSLMAFVSWYHIGLSEEFIHKWFYVRLPRALSFYKL
jgi:glycosyltransferase involved in cell wall biosynthesis